MGKLRRSSGAFLCWSDPSRWRFPIGNDRKRPIADKDVICDLPLMRQGVLISCCGLMVVSSPAVGTLPASTEQLICGASSMVMGEVMTVQSRDCRLTAGPAVTDCEPKALASITIQRVGSALEGSQLPEVGDRFEVDTSGFIEDGNLNTRLGRTVMTNADLEMRLRGKRFYIGVWTSPTWRRPWAKLWNPDGTAAEIWRKTCPHSLWRVRPQGRPQVQH
ncbi:hypothetical protein SPDO_33110 [Sphingomonas dokdonensis]|uniref:Uncharacterized protein n=1 Tax=Sphingomonas dokdonensis TaxID=344880 RepID=A0A245ZCW9_9SPHN|nr:hypothetical protein SPDO_33110 [Sphingomonas dokdonensis]